MLPIAGNIFRFPNKFCGSPETDILRVGTPRLALQRRWNKVCCSIDNVQQSEKGTVTIGTLRCVYGEKALLSQYPQIYA